MKRLLLTLLGAAALCGLSPHPAQAQEPEIKTKTVTFSGTDNPEFMYSKQIKAIPGTATNANNTSITTLKAVYIPNESKTKPTAVTAWDASNINSNAQGQLNWNDFQMEMDYSNAAIPSTTSYKSYWSLTSLPRQGWLYTTKLITEDEGLFNVYPGIDIKFSVPGKRISKVTVHTGIKTTHATTTGAQSFNAYKMTTNLRVIDKLGSNKNTQTGTKSTMQFVDNNGKADIVLTSNELFGSDDGIYLKVNGYDGMFHTKSGTSSYYYYPIPLTTEATSGASATSRPTTAAYQNSIVFRITSIDVEYYESSPLTKILKYNKNSGDKILYKNQDNDQWEEKTTSWTLTKANAKETEYIKIGDVIFEICNGGEPNPAFGTNRLQIDPSSGKGLGLFILTKFRVYPDPEKYKMDDGKGAKAYRIILKSSGKNSSSTFSYGYLGGQNILQCHAVSTTKFDRVIQFPTTDYIASNLITAITETGMGSDIDNWISLSRNTSWTQTSNSLLDVTNASYSINFGNGYAGKSPIAWIDGVELEISTDTPNPPASPKITTDLPAGKLQNGIWHATSPINITMTPQTDDYDNHTIKYIESATPLNIEEIDWAAENVNTYDAPFKSNASMYYYACVESDHKGETYRSEEVAKTATKIINPVIITDLADLHKNENNGKVVQLDMPLMVRAHTLVYPQDATNKYTNAVYARDVNGASVKLISRRNKKEDPYFPYSNSTFSPLTYAFNGVNPTLSLMKPGMVIGMYHYNGGKNPEIVVRDLTSDPAVDVQPSAIAY